MTKILICVDCQYDFIEGGNLPVSGARAAVDTLAAYLSMNSGEYDAIVCTLDWHPQTHCSFVANGGTWPVHCVQHTHGAALDQKLVDVLPADRLHIYLKGRDTGKDEYSFLDNGKNAERFDKLVQAINPDIIDLCGIAGDVCVMNTARSLIGMGLGSKITMLLPAVASLDTEVTKAFVTDNSIATVNEL